MTSDMTDLDCHYEVEWVTEYACPEQHINTADCKLKEEQRGIDLDLTPLGKLYVYISRAASIMPYPLLGRLVL